MGGGTPSLLTAGQLAGLINSIKGAFRVNDDAEITMEANPGTVDESYLASARKLGINRLSLGVQSFDVRILSILGRFPQFHSSNRGLDHIFPLDFPH